MKKVLFSSLVLLLCSYSSAFSEVGGNFHGNRSANTKDSASTSTPSRQPKETLSETSSLKKFLGTWSGSWYGSMTGQWMGDQTLEIIKISANDKTATVNYTFSGRTKKGAIMLQGQFERDDLVIVFPSGSMATYKLSGNGKILYGELSNSYGKLKGTLRRV